MQISTNAAKTRKHLSVESIIPGNGNGRASSKAVMGAPSPYPCEMEDLSIDYTKEDGFMKGFLLALPISALLWAAVILGINTVFF